MIRISRPCRPAIRPRPGRCPSNDPARYQCDFGAVEARPGAACSDLDRWTGDRDAFSVCRHGGGAAFRDRGHAGRPAAFCAADRLNTQVLAMGVYERHHHSPWWSSSAIAKYADALRRLSLARRNSFTSRSSSLSRTRSSPVCAAGPARLLAAPTAQSLGRAADLGRNRGHRGPLQVVIDAMLANHTDSTLPDLSV